jgi:hypothetical protein
MNNSFPSGSDNQATTRNKQPKGRNSIFLLTDWVQPTEVVNHLVTTRRPLVEKLWCTRWFKYDRDWLCVNKSQFVPVIFEPPCIWHLQDLSVRTNGAVNNWNHVLGFKIWIRWEYCSVFIQCAVTCSSRDQSTLSHFMAFMSDAHRTFL